MPTDPRQPEDETDDARQRLRAILGDLRDAACVECHGEGSTITPAAGYQTCAHCGGSGYHTPRAD